MNRRKEFEAVVVGHQQGVWAWLRYLGAPRTLAEDLVQETFLTFFQKPFRDQGSAATAAYLRAIARNHYLHALRGAARRKETNVGDHLDLSQALSPGDLVVADDVWERLETECRRDERRETLRQCIEELDERSRKAVELHYREERKGEDIAGIIGVSLDGLYSLVKRARAKLRACVERKLP